MRWAWIALLAVVALAAVAFGGVLRPGGAHGKDSTDPARSITVTGNGIVDTVPDRAQFSFGVHTESATASAALGANSALMTKVIAAIEQAGVASKDVQTQQVSLSPMQSPDGKRITGYAADNSVSVLVRDISPAGSVVDAAVAAGANQVSGPDLTSSDQTALYQQALKKAMDDAKAKAGAIADGGGVSLGDVMTVVEGSGASPLPGLEASAKTPIAAGTEQVTATVTVTYEIS